MNSGSDKGSTPAEAVGSAIAIVGVGCRFPGGVRNLDSYGRLLTSATDVFADVPPDRWGAEYHDAAGGPGTISNRRGAFLDDIDRFDAPFFGVTPREAALLDPQQRLILEVAWEAMTDSGRTREEWSGTRTAVMFGLLAKDYELLHARTLGVEGIGQHHVSGLEFSFAAGRLAYTFDLNGPVSAVNSACSSSLLAVHQACQSLRAGDCDTALAGGVSLLVTPDISVFLSRVGAISPTGRCRPFDASADGIVRGEGAGVVVLKRLADALADGDRVHAVVRGSAANNDGTSMGLTVPNSLAQASLLETALRRAGLSPADLDYVEAHGTGTAIGDVIEVDAIGEVYGAGRDRDNPLLVGSHKALLGHMDAAAGIGGLLKATWAVGSGTIPRQPHVDALNPGVNWRDGAVTVPADHIGIDAPGRPARAGVSAFGLSGTNVHVIVEAPGTPAPEPRDGDAAHPYVLLASSTGPRGLAEQVSGLRELAAGTADEDLADLTASTTTRRTHETHRFAVVATGRDGIVEALEDPEEPQDGAYAGVVPDPDSAPRPVFVYSGQGGQWPGMALDLYAGDPVVREALDECAELIRAEAGWSLIDEIRDADPETGLQKTEVVQPAIFAVQVAMGRWLAAKGVRPGAIVGHSLGEVAAAHAAGALSLEAATTLIVRRSETLGMASGRGLMYAVTADEESVTAALAGTGLPVTVVAVNGPGSLIVAGAAEHVGEAARAMESRGMRCRLLRVDAPAHSPLIADLGDRLESALSGLPYGAPSVRMLSTVDPDAEDTVHDAAYWVRNFTSPVRLWPAVDRLLAEDDHPFVEVGPHPVLVPSLTEAQRHRGRQAAVVPVLSRYEPGPVAAHKALARLHVAGAPVRWEEVTGRPRRYRTLPVPSWGGDRYWLPGVERGQQVGGGRSSRTGAAALPARVKVSLLDANDQVTAELYATTDGTAPVSAPVTAAAVPVSAPAPASVAPAPAVSPVPSRKAPAAAARPRTGALTELVTATVRELLGLPEGQQLGRRRGLFEQGLDSLTAVALRTRLEQELGVTLPTTIVFERPTISGLAEYLAEVAPAHQPEAAPEPVAAAVAEPAGAVEPAAGPGDDGIAVIGVSCRLPGASTPQEFWDLLSAKTPTATPFPKDRLADPIWSELGDAIPMHGSYLDNIADFDAPFFRISPREAKLLDPQQRLFLETAWEALEDAGCPAHTLDERPVGVYAGLSMADYQYLVARDMEPSKLNLYHGTGTSFAALAGRLSYILGLRGPSMTVDTACSASLTAVHLACQALRSGDCEVAVVGGASAIVAPSPLMASMGASGALAPDGRCKAFDEDADGFGCGEGAVVLVLKPVSAAVRDGDRVYAVLRGSAVNQDGATGGLTVPNPAAQADLVRRALARTGWAPHEVDYVETHGTGTPLGDPIEVRALAESLGPGRDPEHPVLIGSAKANVGHLGAAAGAVGLLKVVLSLHRGALPPHLVNRSSSRIDWDRLPVRLVTEAQEWPHRDRPARAGVSAFGFSGSNAHVMVEQFDRNAPAAPQGAADAGPEERVLLVTAATPAALKDVARRMAERLRATPEDVADVVFTATHRRSLLDHRLAVVGSDAASLADALEAHADGLPTPSAYTGHVENGEEQTVAFRYGTELPDPGARRRWAERSSAYDRTLEEFARLLTDITGSAFDPRGEATQELRAAQVFCHQAAATNALRALGISAHASVGEGPGRVTAAWASGLLSAADGLRLLVAGDAAAAPAPDADADAMCDVEVRFAQVAEAPASVAAGLFVAGCRPVAPEGLVAPSGGKVVGLPGYPWEHLPYWYREFTAPQPVPWMLSADTESALREQVDRLREFVTRGGAELDPAAVAQALAERAVGRHRLAVVGERREELLAGLDSTAHRGVVSGVVRAVLVFPGQGWQWAGMGAELLECSQVFAAVVDECSAVVQELAGWSVRDVLTGNGPEGAWERVDVVQPVMFTVMVALARLWESVGIVPQAVVGHSQGEIAAACVAGALTIPDALRVVVARSQALTRLAGGGAMISVATGADHTRQLLEQWPDRLWLAAVNGPASTVIAGDTHAADTFLTHCEQAGVRARRIPVDYASHTPHVETVATDILTALDNITPQPARIPLYSTVTAAPIDTTTMDAAYWVENLRSPVRFQDTTQALLDDGFTHFIETSAHPVLTPGITDTIDTHPTTNPHTTTVTGTLRRNDATLTRFLTNAAHTWTTGLPLTWTTHNSQVQPLELPLDEPAEAKGARPSGADLEERRFWRMVEQQDGQELAGLLGLGQEADRASLEAVLPVLSGWWQRHRENTAVNDWRYRIAWRPVPADAPRAALTGTWFLVVPRQLAGPEVSDLAAACGRSIDEHGGKAVVIAVDASAENLTEVTDALTASADQPVGGVLSLLALDESPHPDHPVIPSGLVATVRLMQAMENAGCDARLWSATSGAVSTASGDELSHPVQAHLWGLNRVAGLENPHRFAGLVDLPPALDDTTGALLCSALAGIGDEDQLAVRDNGIHVRRLVRASLDNTQPSSPWQPSGTTLITGGTGALGGHVARWLSRKGAHVLLLSRRGPDAPGAEELRGELTELGAASVTITACDIADEDALAGVIGAIPADRPLTAVIHTAGVVDDGPVNEMTAEQLERVLLPKTRAVENLHRLTEDHDLSAFVLYSSYGNLLPNVGQGAYAAGNAYLDAFARHRRAAGRPATSIAWGAWAGKGMAEDQGFIDWLSLGGMDLMTPHLGVMALQQALDHDDTFVAIANVDWERFAERFNTTRPHPLVSELVTPHTAATAAPAPRETTEAVRLADLPEAQRKSELLRLVCAELATVLGYSGTQDIDPDVAFKELGIDSVTAIEFRNRINAVTGLRFSPVSVFDHPTSEALTEHLLSRMPRPEGTTPGEGTAPQQQVRKDSEDKEVEEGAAREAQPGGSRIDSMALEDLVRMARGANGS